MEWTELQSSLFRFVFYGNKSHMNFMFQNKICRDTKLNLIKSLNQAVSQALCGAWRLDVVFIFGIYIVYIYCLFYESESNVNLKVPDEFELNWSCLERKLETHSAETLASKWNGDHVEKRDTFVQNKQHESFHFTQPYTEQWNRSPWRYITSGSWCLRYYLILFLVDVSHGIKSGGIFRDIF